MTADSPEAQGNAPDAPQGDEVDAALEAVQEMADQREAIGDTEEEAVAYIHAPILAAEVRRYQAVFPKIATVSGKTIDTVDELEEMLRVWLRERDEARADLQPVADLLNEYIDKEREARAEAERLREENDKWSAAMQENCELRAEVERLRGAVSLADDGRIVVAARLSRAEAEAARLREALESIREAVNSGRSDIGIVALCRAALGSGETEGNGK